MLAGLVTRLWEELDRPCPERLVAVALRCADRRRAPTGADRRVVVHGDPHPGNALQVLAPRTGAPSGFVLVDPDGFVARQLDERIAGLEVEIAEGQHVHHTDGVVSVGDVVTVDLGEGDETYLIGSVEQAAAGVDTITPGSPLGRAIVGAAVGATVTYQPRYDVTMSATIRSIGELLAPSA